MQFSPDMIDEIPTPGRRTPRLYRRVDIDYGYTAMVRYDPALEEMVPDVRQYIADHLNGMVAKASYGVVCAWLGRVVDVPLPE